MSYCKTLCSCHVILALLTVKEKKKKKKNPKMIKCIPNTVESRKFERHFLETTGFFEED